MKEERIWLNPYNYVQNNPINRVDPTGMVDEGLSDKQVSTPDKPILYENGNDNEEKKKEEEKKTNSKRIGDNEIRSTNGAELGKVNLDRYVVSKNQKYTLHRIQNGVNKGNWLVREYFDNYMYKNSFIVGKAAFADVVREEFTPPEEDIPENDESEDNERPRTVREIYCDLANEQEAFEIWLRERTWKTFWVALGKRIFSQFTNPLNYAGIRRGGTPKIVKFRAKVHKNMTFDAFKNETRLPKNFRNGMSRKELHDYRVKKWSAKNYSSYLSIERENIKFSKYADYINSGIQSTVQAASNVKKKD
jgi:hypothetical protein